MFLRYLYNFNSIKVQLERKNFLDERIALCNFNSIKVQLEHVQFFFVPYSALISIP